jgi:hypothetical protein
LEGWDTMGGDADGASEPSFLRDAEEQLQALDVDGMSSVSVVSSMAHLPVNEENAELRERNLQLRARLADEIRAREREMTRLAVLEFKLAAREGRTVDNIATRAGRQLALRLTTLLRQRIIRRTACVRMQASQRRHASRTAFLRSRAACVRIQSMVRQMLARLYRSQLSAFIAFMRKHPVAAREAAVRRLQLWPFPPPPPPPAAGPPPPYRYPRPPPSTSPPPPSDPATFRPSQSTNGSSWTRSQPSFAFGGECFHYQIHGGTIPNPYNPMVLASTPFTVGSGSAVEVQTQGPSGCRGWESFRDSLVAPDPRRYHDTSGESGAERERESRCYDRM